MRAHPGRRLGIQPGETRPPFPEEGPGSAGHPQRLSLWLQTPHSDEQAFSQGQPGAGVVLEALARRHTTSLFSVSSLPYGPLSWGPTPRLQLQSAHHTRNCNFICARSPAPPPSPRPTASCRSQGTELGALVRRRGGVQPRPLLSRPLALGCPRALLPLHLTGRTEQFVKCQNLTVTQIYAEEDLLTH